MLEFPSITRTLMLLTAPVLLAQPPYQSQSASSIAVSVKDGAKTIQITNVEFEVVASAASGRLVLRKTSQSKQVVDEIGTEAAVTVEAWPFDKGLKHKPLYTLKVAGSDARTINGELLSISRGPEEVEWWSLYKLGSGTHLFDTYVPLLSFSISRETLTQRYIGLEVPPDDSADARLKAPSVVAVLTYASAGRVIREALITSGDPTRAKLLRSYADSTRTISLETKPQAVKIVISQNFPSAPQTISIQVPIANDDLDLPNAQLPQGLRIAAWKR